MSTRIMDKLRTKRATDAANFHDLARKIAAGENVDLANISNVLRDSGKTDADLAGAVEAARKRLELRSKAERAAEVRKAIADAEKKLAVEVAKVEQAQARYAECGLPLEWRLGALQRELAECDQARAALRRSCDDEMVMVQLNDVRARINELSRERFALQTAAADNARWAEAANGDADTIRKGALPTRPGQLAMSAARCITADARTADEHEARATEFKRLASDAAARVTSIDAELSALRQAELDVLDAIERF